MRCGPTMLVAPLALAVVLAACASTDSSRAAREAAALPGMPACFFQVNFRGDWQVLNDSTLIVYAPLADRYPYLIKLFRPIVGLRFHQRLGFYNPVRNGQICNDGAADLVVPGFTPERVPITAVRRLSTVERNQLLAQAGQPVPHREASRPPPTSEQPR